MNKSMTTMLLLGAVAATGAAHAASVQRTADGGYILFGSYNIENSLLFKVDDHGELLWKVPITAQTAWIANITDDILLGNALQTTDGGYILGYNGDYPNRQGHLTKVSGNGTSTAWDKTFGHDDDNGLYNVQPTADGGYIAAGYTSFMGAGGNDAWLLKVDGNGQQQWSAPYGTSDNEEFYAVRPTADGGYVAVGTYNNNYDAWIVKVDNKGQETWGYTIGSDDAFVDVQQTADGGYIMAGYRGDNNKIGGSYSRGWLVKLSNANKIEWSTGLNSTPIASSVQQTADGGYITCGYTPTTAGSGGLAFLVIKLDGAGNVQWQNNYGDNGTGDHYASSVLQTPDGGYVVYGRSYTLYDGTGTRLVKINADGSAAWEKFYPAQMFQ
jgi:hypothetical protein